MPTLPPPGSGSSASGSGSSASGSGSSGSGSGVPGPGSEQFRQVATSFGTNAQRYDRARPSYPRAMVDRLLAASPRTGSGPRVLDVGCGTGIVARLFQAAGARVLGVDPDERMAAQARAGGVEVEVARIEEWDPAGATFNMVVAGQAWHWIDPVAGASTAGRALQPGGRLAVFWNSFRPPPGLGEAMTAVVRRVVPDAPLGGGLPGPDGYARLADRAFGGMRAAEVFQDMDTWFFDWERPYTRDEWLDAVPTFGGSNRMPAAQLNEVLAGIGSAIDDIGGRFTMGYTTVVATALKTGVAPGSEGLN
jgi:SAM-dependent methyltransferase